MQSTTTTTTPLPVTTLPTTDLPAPLRDAAATSKRTVTVAIIPDGGTVTLRGSQWDEGSRILTEVYSLPRIAPDAGNPAAPLAGPLTPATVADRHHAGGFPAFTRGEPLPLADAEGGRFYVVAEGGIFRGKAAHVRLTLPATVAAAFGWNGSGFESGPATWRENPERDGVEITFGSKPSAEIRAGLKAAGFRWSRRFSCWYAKRTPERLALAAHVTTL